MSIALSPRAEAMIRERIEHGDYADISPGLRMVQMNLTVLVAPERPLHPPGPPSPCRSGGKGGERALPRTRRPSSDRGRF